MRRTGILVLTALIAVATLFLGCGPHQGGQATGPSTASTSTATTKPSSTTAVALADYESRLADANIPVKKITVLSTSPLRIEIELRDVPKFEGFPVNVPGPDDWVFSAIGITAQAKADGFPVDELSLVYQSPQDATPTRVVTTIQPWRGGDVQAMKQHSLAFWYLVEIFDEVATQSGVKDLGIGVQGGKEATRSLSWSVVASGDQAQVDHLLKLLSTTLDDLETQGARITECYLRVDRPGLSSMKWTWEKDLSTGQVTVTGPSD